MEMSQRPNTLTNRLIIVDFQVTIHVVLVISCEGQHLNYLKRPRLVETYYVYIYRRYYYYMLCVCVLYKSVGLYVVVFKAV